eukprot:UN31370
MFPDFIFMLGKDWSAKDKYWPHEVYAQECTFTDIDRPDEYWITRRFGPFYSTGGGEWINIVYTDRHTQRYFTGRHFARYDSNGKILGYPPIHVHHEHVSSTVNIPGLASLFEDTYMNRIAFAHADDVCPQDKGGIDCLAYKSYQKGVGVLESKHVYDVVLQD